MKYKRHKTLHLFLVLILVSISFSGSNCDKVLQNNGDPVVPDLLIGSWTLSGQTGALQDICPDENISYQSTGIAQLTCPGSTTISRNFMIENDVLTYTQTSIEYDMEFFEDDNGQNLALYGRNVSRNLFYLKIPALNIQPVTTGKQDAGNSSEAQK